MIAIDAEPAEQCIEVDDEGQCIAFDDEVGLSELSRDLALNCQGQIEIDPEPEGDSEPLQFHDCIELAEIDAPAEVDENAWVPGKDVGRFIHKGLNPIQEQSQVILINVVRSCMSLSAVVLRSVIEKLPDLKSADDSSTGRLAYKAAARICRVGASTLRNLHDRVWANSWTPVPVAKNLAKHDDGLEGQAQGASGPKHGQPRSPENVMRLLLREALYGSARGHADVEFIHAVRRLNLADVDVGDKYASVNFVRLAEQVASRYLAESDASQVSDILPTLGVRSPVSLTFDPVTLGSGMFSRHETLQVVMVRFLTSQGSVRVMLMDARSMGMFHDGQSQTASIVAALEEHPAHLTVQSLRARLVSVISGDGAVAAGGPAAKHSSSKTCELIWMALYPPEASTASAGSSTVSPGGGSSAAAGPPAAGSSAGASAGPSAAESSTAASAGPSAAGSSAAASAGPAAAVSGPTATWTMWDPFHRCHCAFAAALSRMAIVQELYALGRSMSANFGVHSGRVLFRSLAEQLQEPLYAVDSGSGARKVYQLSRVAENLLQNFRLYMAGLHSKMQLKRQGHGHQSQSALVAVARRLGSVEMVGFMLLFSDVMRLRIQPFVLLTEREGDPPWVSQRQFQKMMQELKEDMDRVSAVRRLVFFSCLLNFGRNYNIENVDKGFLCALA
eukprot:s418_g34.t1